MNQLEVGDILLARNAGGEDINTSPGWWNHVAIFVGDRIVEAQAEPQMVVMSRLPEFWNRYPYIVVLRFKIDAVQRVQAARNALQLVGVPYRRIASIFFVLRPATRGENCVSVVRKAYRDALRMDPGWRKPDSLWMDQRLRQVITKVERE